MSTPRALTHAQSQIWVGQQLHPQSPLYNMAFAFVFQTPLRPDVFRAAWRLACGASDALRTRIVTHDGAARAVVEAAAPELDVLDLSSHADAEAEFLAWSRQRCARPFSVGGDLVDSVLVDLGAAGTGWFLNQHHVIADAQSTRLVYDLVARAYEQRLQGEVEEPLRLPSFYDTADALARATGDRPSARAHWAPRRERPGRAVPLYGRRTVPVDTPSLRSTLQLDDDRARAIDRLAQQDGFASPAAELSRFTVFAAVLAAWLHRVSGHRDVGFDAPVGGRRTAAAKRSPGLFIEMFPFAARVEAGDTFRSLGARCLEEAAGLLLHGWPGLSAPSAATSSTIVLNYVPGAFGPLAGVRPSVTWVHPGHGDRVHALRVQVHDFEGTGRWTVHFDVNEGVLAARQRQHALAHFERLLDAALGDPDRTIESVDLQLADERDALERLNDTGARPLPDRSIVSLFRERAHTDPERVAVRQGAVEVSFGELLARVEAMAFTLVGLGVQPGDRVAIAGTRSILSVVAILGTLRARAAFVPIDPAAPPSRVAQLLGDSEARVLLVGERTGPEAAPAGMTMLRVAEVMRGTARESLHVPDPQLDDLAYLMYTSGSTGRPKGVPIDHGGLADYLRWAERTYVRGDRLAFPLCTALTFDLTVTSLFLPLITGGTLDVYPEPDGPVDSAVLDVVAANRVDFIKVTPSHLSVLRRVGLENSRIRRIVVGGEDLKVPLAAAISAQLGDAAEIWNEYGPTEAVVGCVAHRFDASRDTDASVPIGAPADHVTVEVLNEAQAPVPEGVPGELWISRFGLSRGYHRLPQQTAERFQPHPLRPGARRYRTGDLVRVARPGTLEYLGRIDRQVKVSGFRVEPGEIEAALSSAPGVEQCAVVARQAHGSPAQDESVRHCARCGLPSNYPRVTFDDDNVCGVCRSYESIKDHAQAYFKTMADLRAVFAASAQAHPARAHDCLVLYSGGKDSTYALGQLVDMGLSVYAFTFDNGFISESAKENIRRVTAHLGVPIEFATTPEMPAIFRDSLLRFSNVCNGCFKTIYTLAMQRARELGIPVIVTGLSRGQMFETRFTEEMFRDGRCSPEEIDAAVLAARKVYHRTSDEVSRRLDVRAFADDGLFDAVQFVDFYRYCDVDMETLYAYLSARLPWVRPADTGRSTNCLINDIGIYVHKKERGFHNYALPYSWDVRLGHKQRDAALDELDDDIDEEHVRRTLAAIGYDADRVGAQAAHTRLEAFYVSRARVGEDEIRRHLATCLPAQLVPLHVRRVDAIPLTPSGKVDERALLHDATWRESSRPYRAPEGPVQEYLATVWQEELGAEQVGADDSFFELGGTSLVAMQVMVRLCREFAIDLPLATVFTHPRLADLARIAEDRILADVAETPSE